MWDLLKFNLQKKHNILLSDLFGNASIIDM